MNQMDLGEFIAFAKDFSVGLDKRIVAEVFKKVSRSQKPLKDYQFQIALQELGLRWHKFHKIESLEKERAQKEKEYLRLKKQHDKREKQRIQEMQEEREEKIYIQAQPFFHPLEKELQELTHRLKENSLVSNEEIRDDFIKFLELKEPQKYLRKIKGYVMPFNTHAKKNQIELKKSSQNINKEAIR